MSDYAPRILADLGVREQMGQVKPAISRDLDNCSKIVALKTPVFVKDCRVKSWETGALGFELKKKVLSCIAATLV
jgi:hypothetical protein